jgi:hypothetical protein
MRQLEHAHFVTTSTAHNGLIAQLFEIISHYFQADYSVTFNNIAHSENISPCVLLCIHHTKKLHKNKSILS